MSQHPTPTEFANAVGPAPEPKQNNPELEVGPVLASDLPSLNVSDQVAAVPVIAHDAASMPAPYLYVPALSQPNHPMKVQSRNGQWLEMARSVDLRHFGQVIDNRGSDIGIALNNFIDYAKEKGGGTVYIPPGIFSLESPVDASINLPADNIGIGIFGYGTEVSRIVVDGASVSHGPRFTSTNRAAYFHFEKFALLADGTVSGRPLEATMPVGGSRRNCSHVVRDLLVQGLDSHQVAGSPYTDHFTHGFNFTGAWRLIYENNHVSGPVVDSVKTHADWSDSSILWRMTDGLLIDGAYAPVVRDAQFYFIAQPVICGGDPGGPQEPGNVEAERAMFHNVRCPTCKTAIDWFRTGAEPELVITDCFFDYRDHGVKIKGSRLGQIFRNAFFQKTDTDVTRAVPADIELEHCIDFHVDHNLHHEAGDTRRVGVRLLDTSTQSGYVTDGIEIRKNRISSIGVLDTYLVKGADTDTVIYEPGGVAGSLTREINDDAATTKTTLDLRSPYVLSLSLPSPGQAITSGSWQTLDWDTVENVSPEVASAWSAGTPDEIVVPADRGIAWVQMRLNVEFPNNANGLRRIQVLKNGGFLANGLVLTQNATNGAPTAMAGTTDWFAVAPGDVLAVRVQQDSGATLNTDPPTTLTVQFR